MKLYESETVELKEIYTLDLKKEIVAFANTSGGTIYIGVQDSGEIIGVDNADFVIQQISNSLRDSLCRLWNRAKPHIYWLLEALECREMVWI